MMDECKKKKNLFFTWGTVKGSDLQIEAGVFFMNSLPLKHSYLQQLKICEMSPETHNFLLSPFHNSQPLSSECNCKADRIR